VLVVGGIIVGGERQVLIATDLCRATKAVAAFVNVVVVLVDCVVVMAEVALVAGARAVVLGVESAVRVWGAERQRWRRHRDYAWRGGKWRD
jgi:hypothetical protein